MGDLFSRREGYLVRREITIREDAPHQLREALIATLRNHLGLNYTKIREIVCQARETKPDPNNWSEVPNVRDEVYTLVMNCDWPRVYDICEAAYQYLSTRTTDPDLAERFTSRLNQLFEEYGIGWQMVDGQIVTRGPEEFQPTVQRALEDLQEGGYQTAKQELEQARRDLSRRPEPDITGCIDHCMRALECIARLFSDDERATLGKVIQCYAAQIGIRKPLDQAIEKMWGYASEAARHVREGGELPGREEAELLLAISAALISYLLQKNRSRPD